MHAADEGAELTELGRSAEALCRHRDAAAVGQFLGRRPGLHCTGTKGLLQLKQAGVDVVLDDRNERPGVKFADLELTGIPHRVVVGERGLDAGTFEYRGRRDSDARDLSKTELLALLTAAQV